MSNLFRDNIYNEFPDPNKKIETLQTSVSSNTSQLTDVAININSFSGTDSQKLQSALNSAQAKKSVVLFPPATLTYIIDSDLVVPDGVDLVGHGITIKLRGLLTLAGNNKVTGIAFDGDSSSKGILVSGAGCEISYNTFKNFKASVSGQTNVINFVTGIGDALIYKNTFDGIQPYAENTTVGDDIGAARAVRITGSNVTVEGNTFKNMSAFEDGDYIHVLSTQVTNNSYPYGTYLFSLLDNVVIKNNTFYQTQNKACIKLQASGCTVRGNTFILNNSSTSHYAIIRVQHTDQNKIIYNDIRSTGAVMNLGVLIEYSTNCEVSYNQFNTAAFTYGANDTCSIIQLQSSQGIKVKYNSITSEHTRDIFLIDSTDYVTISKNTVNITNGVNNYILRGVNSFSRKSTNFVFDDNDIVGQADNLNSIVLQISQLDGAIFTKTDIYGGYFNAITFSDCNNIKVFSTSIVMNGTDPSYPLSTNANVTNVEINGLRVYRSTPITAFIRLYNAVTNLVVSELNGATASGGIYDQATTLGNVTYKQGGSKVMNLDYGYTASRPTCKLEIGHIFFDRNLNKNISWDGTGWRDQTGALV